MHTRNLPIILAICLIIVMGACQGQSVQVQPHQPGDAGYPAEVTKALSELATLACPAGVDGAVFEQLRGALRDMLIAKGGSAADAKSASCLPVNDAQMVTVDTVDYLQWRYNLIGDYDLNGGVNISDLTPLGMNFGSQVGPGTPARVAFVDGDGNGEINIADITPIAAHFNQSIGSYSLYRSPVGADPAAWVEAGSASRWDVGNDFYDDLLFRYQLEADHADYDYKVIPSPSDTWHYNETGGPDSYPPPTGAISGLVTNEAGQPLAGAGVKLSLPGSSTEYSAATDAAGLYIIPGINLTGTSYWEVASLVKCNVAGYAEGIEQATLNYNGCAARDFTLIERVPHGALNAKVGGAVGTKHALQLSVPPNGLVRADGTPMLSTASVNLTYIDYTDPAQLASAPGDLAARQEDGSSAQLESYGMAEVFIDDGTGQEANLAPGTTAEMSFPIPEDQRAGAPQTSGMYSFNEDSGQWIEEGTAVKNADGTAYIAEIGHLSFWNVDKPIDPTHIVIKVSDVNGTPLAGVLVTSAGVSYSGTTSQSTNSSGLATFVVKQSAVELVSAEYMGRSLGEPQQVNTPAEFVESYNAPLVATFIAPNVVTVFNILPESDTGQALPYASIYLRDGQGLWLKQQQAGQDGLASVALFEGETLTIWGTFGAAASASEQLTIGGGGATERHLVIPGASLPPIARFSASAYSGIAPYSVTLDASTSTPASTISSYHWTIMREGETVADVSGASPQYVLEIPVAGHYRIDLDVQTSNGDVDTQSGAVCAY